MSEPVNSVTMKILQPLWYESSPRTNNCLAYSDNSYSGIGPQERALYDQENEPTIFLPSGVSTKPRPNPDLFFLGLGLGLVYYAGQKYRWLIFLVVPALT